MLAVALAVGVGGGGAVADVSTVDTQEAVADLDGRAILKPGTHGYHCYRIPALVTANDGTLLMFAEGRKPDCSDTGKHDVIVVRSSDGGRNWSDPQVVHAGVDATAHNPAPVVDRETGRISLLTTRRYRTAWAQYSEDNGRTWTEPREVTGDVSLDGWTQYATGPSHGIQLTRGEHAGRLVVGTTHRAADGSKGGSLVYSDDGGLSWRLGAYDHSAAPGLQVQELSVYERPDASLVAFARDQNPDNDTTVASAVFTDGGTTVAEPFHAGRAEKSLTVPTVQASTLELRATDKGDRYNRVLLASASRQGDRTRERMTIRSTFKGGDEWVSPSGGTVIYQGMSAYTDMTLIGPGTVGLAYERAQQWSHGYLWFTTFTEADLGLPDGDTAALPVTPDDSPHGLDAWLHGGAGLAPGRFGRAASLDGSDDYVQLPFAEKLATSGGDFTWTGWFNYGASTAEQALLWAYNLGAERSQLWLRAEPGNGRIRAWAEYGPAGPVALSTQGAYADRSWHHFALQREGGVLRLYLDGELAASASGLSGSVSPRRPFQIHLGQRLDGANRLRGSLDEVRLYGRALSGAEVERLATSAGGPAEGLRLHLPFDLAY